LNESDLHLLTRRIDINKNGKISISEIRTIFNNVTGKSSAIEEHRINKIISVHKNAMTSPRKNKHLDTSLDNPQRSSQRNLLNNTYNNLDSSFNLFKKDKGIYYSPNKTYSYLKDYRPVYPYPSSYVTNIENRNKENYRSHQNNINNNNLSSNSNYEQEREDNVSQNKIFQNSISYEKQNQSYVLNQSTNQLNTSSTSMKNKLSNTSIASKKKINTSSNSKEKIISKIKEESSPYILKSKSFVEVSKRIAPYSEYSPTADNFHIFLKEILILENEIEKIKRELALLTDFNVPDAFSLFEITKKGYLNEQDLQFGLDILDIAAKPEEVSLVYRKYCSKDEAHIK